MIIGLTGSNASGKDSVAEYIVKAHNFLHYSLSDVIRDLMKSDGIEITRENLIVYGTNLRQKNGNGFLAKKVLEKMDKNKNYCVTSIRHPDEVMELRKNKDFVLINVDALQNIRFERLQKRNRPGDPTTFEKFINLEQKESQISGSGQQLTKTAKLADITLINNSNDLNILHRDIDKLLAQLSTAK